MSTKKTANTPPPSSSFASVVASIFLALYVLAVIWATFYFNQVLSCGGSTFFSYDWEYCATRWAIIPLWLTGITLIVVPLSIFTTVIVE